MTWADVLATCFSGDGDVYGDGAEWKMNAKSKKPNRSKRSPADNAWKQGSLQSKPSFWGLSNPNSSSHLTKDLLVSLGSSNICAFTLNELQSITNNFSRSYLLGEGGFGPVYKGFVGEKLRHGVLKPQPVAVKLLDLEGLQGHREWQAEVTYLGQLKYPHVVKLIGYCCEEEQRILVYEFMARGSLENHLFKRFSASLPWSSRLKIAVGAAKGLAFLHGQDKPIIYRDFKASNILLDSDFTAKLSDFGLAKDGPEGEETHVSTRVMGTHGYAAPEYVMKGHLTAKSDVYSFGVVLLELLTGLRAVDKKRPVRKQNLVEWARPRLLIHESRKLNHIMDPNLEGQYSIKGAQKAAALAYRCLAHHPKNRPVMSSVVEILEPLQQLKDNMITHFVYSVSTAENGKSGDRKQQGKKPTAAKEINNIHGHSHDHRKRNEGRRAGHRNRSPVSVMSSTQSWSSNSDGSSCRNSPSPRHDKGGGEEPI